MQSRKLIVNADDFGISPGISHGILYAIRKGIVTSTSILLNRNHLSHTQKLVQQNSDINWGIHIQVEDKNITAESIVAKTNEQLGVFQRYFKFKPTHLDYHKGFKFSKKMYFKIRMLVKKQQLEFRYDNNHYIETRFYGLISGRPTPENISTSHLISCLDSLEPGSTELICHPGWTSNRLKDPYRMQRNREVEVLTSDKVKNAIKRKRIDLIDFRQYAKQNKR